MEPPSTLQLMNELLEDKEELEITYGVQIPEDTVSLACSIATRYSDDLLAATKDVNYKSEKSLPGQLAVYLLARACFELTNGFDMGEENCFDVYPLIRAHIELNECKKEKAPTSQCWIDYVTDEYKDLKERWHTLERKWKPVLQLRRRSGRRTQEVEVLKYVRQNLHSYLQQEEVVKPTDLMQLFSLVNVVGKDQNELFTIYPFMIAKVAWSLTGIPKAWLLHSTEPLFLPDIGPSFANRVVGQDLPKLAVTNAMTALGPGTHPIASFLFLCRPGCGRTELAKAVAELFFDEKDRLTEFNMVKYKHADPVSDEDEYEYDFPRSDLQSEFREHLIEAVKKRPFGVVLLDNIEISRPSDVDILVEILTNGRVSDGKGHIVDFTKTVIILTSNVIPDPFMLRCCKCAELVEKYFFKDLDEHSLPNIVCRHIMILRKARKHFRTELFETLNDVIAFEPLSLLHYRCVTRLLLRDIACSITHKRLILCPSEAAIRAILLDSDFMHEGTKSIKSFLQTNVDGMLKHRINEIGDMSVVYMDASVGTEELCSHRCEKISAINYDPELREFLKSSSELRSAYQKEKVWVKKISMLKRTFPELLANENAVKDPVKVSKVMHIIDSLLVNANPENAAVNAFGSEETAEHRDDQLERSKKIAKHGINGLRTALPNLMVNEEFIGTVAEPFLKSINSPQQDLPSGPVKTFLLLGLTEVGKVDLVKGLMEHFVRDDGTSLLFLVDMSKRDDMETCFSSMYTSNEQDLKIVPYSIFFIDRVEDALPFDFNALMQLLDRCTMSDKHGRKIIFSCCIVMIASRAGNKDFIEKLVHRKFSARFSGNAIEQELKTFRFELLNRMDEMVLFSSVVGDQLGKFLRLSMDGGGDFHKNPGKEALAFELVFQDLFLPAKSLPDPPSPESQADSVFYLLKWHVVRDGKLEVMDKSSFNRDFLNGSSENMNRSDTRPVLQLSL